MNVLQSIRAVSKASGTGPIDWEKAAEAAKASTDPGSIDLPAGIREGYAADVRAARTRVRSVTGLDFDVPNVIEIQNRHHWVDANIDGFRNVLKGFEGSSTPLFPEVSLVANTGTLAFTLGFLCRHVLGQYDPLLLADAPDDEHGLYFVHPNIVAAAADLNVEFRRFRRWIAFHEITHAAEFGAAPWLPDYLETRLEDGLRAAMSGGIDRESFGELQLAMTAVEGYAELLMDRAFDERYEDLRRELEARRSGGGPLERLARRVLGLGMKHRQYERGARFFRRVADERGIRTAGVVWNRPENLPTRRELDDPQAWLSRVDP